MSPDAESLRLGRVLLHLHEPTGGQIIYDGKDITNYQGKQLTEVRKKMQMIFQDPSASLDPRKNVKDLIGEPLKNFKVCKNKAEYEERVRADYEDGRTGRALCGELFA